MTSHETLVARLWSVGTIVLRIQALREPEQIWRRNVPVHDSRYGPWRGAQYEILDEAARQDAKPCVYLVRGGDSGFRYVGVSKKGLKPRWRLSPAFDNATGYELADRQLFHNRCWSKIEEEYRSGAAGEFAVAVLAAPQLQALRHDRQLPFTGLPDSDVDPVAAVQWLESTLRTWRRSSLSGGERLFVWNAV